MTAWKWNKVFLAEGIDAYGAEISKDHRAVAIKSNDKYSGWMWVPMPVLLVGPVGPLDTLDEIESALMSEKVSSHADD